MRSPAIFQKYWMSGFSLYGGTEELSLNVETPIHSAVRNSGGGDQATWILGFARMT